MVIPKQVVIHKRVLYPVMDSYFYRNDSKVDGFVLVQGAAGE